MKDINDYIDLECTVLSCLLQKPELMEQCILEDKHFVKNKRIWKFMKAFYSKFHNFDLSSMCSVASSKAKLMQYIIMVLDAEPLVSRFEQYQQQLIDLYEESEKDKWIIDKVYDATMELWVRSKTTQEFKDRIEEIYKNADELFKEGNNE